MHFFNNTALKVEVKAKRSVGDYQDAIQGHFEAMTSLVPRPSTPPVFDRLQYAKTEGEGLVNFIT